MPPFTYQPVQVPLVNTIGQLLLRRGDIEAQRAQAVAEAQARAAATSGDIWGRAMQGIGQSLASIPQQVQASRENAARQSLLNAQVTDVQQRQHGNTAVDQMMAGPQPLPAGTEGPQQDSYLTGDGLFDVKKMSARLGVLGVGHLAPDLLKGAEAINDSIVKHQQLEQQAGQAQTLLLGDLADGALKLAKAGTPLADAMDFVVQPALATKRIQPQDYAQIRDHIVGLPPEQQVAALDTFRDAAAQLGGNKTLNEGAKEVDRYGRLVAEGTPKPKTPAELAYDLSSADETVRERAKKAIEALHPPPKRDDAQLELDAYAKSIGKTNADDLTYADRQTFAQNKEAIKSNAAFQQHMRERQYDIAHPIPEKVASQDKLEQEYRTVLARGLSSRSGGLGLEDAKVQQANHLLALMEQNLDPKTGAYNIPKVQYQELALGLARLISPGGQVGEGMKNDLIQATAIGDLKKVATYLTGTPFNGSTQDVFKMLHDSVQRQGEVAQQNREGEMSYLRGLAPTGLEEPRRLSLESTSLNPLRQSRVIQNSATGERKIQVSIDGGKTWR